MNSTIIYKENGIKLFRRDFSTQTECVEFNIIEIIKDMSRKGIVDLQKINEEMSKIIVDTSQQCADEIYEKVIL